MMVTGFVFPSFMWLRNVASLTMNGCLLDSFGVSSGVLVSREIFVFQLILIGNSLEKLVSSALCDGGNSFECE